MQSQTTDTDALPHRWRNLLPLTGLTRDQVHSACAVARHTLPPRPRRPRSLPPPVRVLLVLIHLRTNLTTRARAVLFATSQSTVDRIIHHLVPVLADALRPAPDTSAHPWIIDGTLIPIHDQSLPRHQQELPAQRQHPDHHRRPPPNRDHGRSGLARQPRATSSPPAQPSHTCSPEHTRSSATAATAESTPSPAPAAASPDASSATITTAHTGVSAPESNTSSPGSNTGKSSTMPPAR